MEYVLIGAFLLLLVVGATQWLVQQWFANKISDVAVTAAVGWAVTRRQCPHCKSLIDREATVCPRCARDVDPLPLDQSQDAAGQGTPASPGRPRPPVNAMGVTRKD